MKKTQERQRANLPTLKKEGKNPVNPLEKWTKEPSDKEI